MRLQKKLLAFSLFLFFGLIFFVSQAKAGCCLPLQSATGFEGPNSDSGKTYAASDKECPGRYISDDCGTVPCGKTTCSTGQKCFDNSKCYLKVVADDENNCVKTQGSNLVADVKWVSDTKSCYLTGDALEKYNNTASLLGFKLTTELKPPTLNFRILDLTFADISKSIDSEGYLHIPWLGQYITAVYKFALGVVSIVAVIMIILQGLTVLMSGGGEEKMAAYKKITQIIIGLALAWGSYAILYNINPNLVEFKAFKVKFIAEKEMDSAIYDKTIDGESSGGELKTATPKPEIEKVFKAYASCFDLDPKILTAIATAESSLNSNAGQGKKYQGLFQESKTYCAD